MLFCLFPIANPARSAVLLLCCVSWKSVGTKANDCWSGDVYSNLNRMLDVLRVW